MTCDGLLGLDHCLGQDSQPLVGLEDPFVQPLSEFAFGLENLLRRPGSFVITKL